MSDVTRIINDLQQGDTSRADELLPLIYAELRRLAAARLAQESPGQTLQATALVHEAYMRLVGSSEGQEWDGRGHFFASAAEAMRRIMVEKARHKRRLKHGGDWRRVEFRDEAEIALDDSEETLLALDAALEQLEKENSRKAQVVKLRFFAGLTISQTASALGISASTADNDWAYARSWLKVQIQEMG